VPKTTRTTKFDEAYAKLNKEQRAAVDAIEGPVMVIAGPGTGKTQILTLRIANILRRTDTAPENILALTFTEAAVAAMRRRLADIIGPSAYQVVIATFHGFCNDIIRRYPESFPRIIGSEHITEVDQIRIIRDLLGANAFEKLKPFGDPYYYVRDILAAVNDLKREGVDAQRFKTIVKDDRKRFMSRDDLHHEKGPHAGKMKGEHQKRLGRLEKNEELATLYASYEETLARKKLYDWSDMIMEVLRRLEHDPNLLRILQEEHQYILVDEHQDTNNAQNRVVELLANFHQNPNVFVVGDEKQAIFRFQGASLENFRHFQTLYSEAKLVVLTENYRSTQNVLDAAESILSGARPLRAKASHPPRPIALFSFSRPEAEHAFIAREAERLIAQGTPPHEIAVLYRDNRDVFPFAAALEQAGIAFSIESDQDVMADQDIRKLILLLRTVNEFGRDEKFLEALHIDFLGIEPLDAWKVIARRQAEKRSAYDIARSADELSAAGLAEPEKVHDLYRKLSGWAKMAKNAAFTDFFEIIVRESGFLAHIINMPDALQKLAKLNGLFDEIKSLIEKHKDYGLRDFLEYLDTLAAHGILVKKSVGDTVERGVRLMTAHRSKGQEFDYVYIVNAYDGHWGNKRKPAGLHLPPGIYSVSGRDVGEDAELDDERRLFYVALTRARKHAVISYASRNADKREQLPSQFVTEIRSELLATGDPGPIERTLDDHPETAFAPRNAAHARPQDREFIAALFAERGLAVTGLNNYLRCPWEYFYTNLLRIPKAPERHQMYGIAVHAALKDFFDVQKDRPADKRFLLAKFDLYLARQPLRAEDFTEAKTKGERALAGWYDAWHNTWRFPALSEFTVPAVFLSNDIRLTGKLDKVEFLNDAGAVNIVDYKTGKPKTRGHIEGATKDSDGDMKRQLVFYKLLLDRHENGKYTMRSGDIDFIEPDEKGRYHKENFPIEPGEVRELENDIRRVADEILNVKFWDRRCGRPECEFCELREMTN
jgi:DNA helicase-2/ATP-dependent DNA helicase PcrA